MDARRASIGKAREGPNASFVGASGIAFDIGEENDMALDEIERLFTLDERLHEDIAGRTPIFDGHTFSVETLSVVLSDESHGYREILHHLGGAGVAVICDNRVCLVRQYRVALGRMSLEIPAGKLDAGEGPAMTAARELREETGLVAGRLVHIATSAGAPGFNAEKACIFAAYDVTQGDAAPDEGELVDVVWVDLDDMVETICAGLIEDAKTVVAVFAAKACVIEDAQPS